jgi:periplasmic protein TonB
MRFVCSRILGSRTQHNGDIVTLSHPPHGLLILLTSTSILLTGCAGFWPLKPKPTPPAPPPIVVPEPPQPVPEPPPPAPRPAEPPSSLEKQSQATTPRLYRRDGAEHIYSTYPEKIYKGRLPPLLQAVGVLDIHLDRQGRVQRLQWQRPPDHVPLVMQEIESLVRAAAPYPVPARLGSVVYTDVWLWDKSGRFQLDTLTEGQN